MSNPFDQEDELFVVLVNIENQHSLWPAFVKIPHGWDATFGPVSRKECIDFVEEKWTDITPRSLTAARSL